MAQAVANLGTLGHLASGVNAPGGAISVGDWSKLWLYKATEMLAFKGDIFTVGDTLDLIDAAVNAGQGPGANCAASGAHCATDCTGTPGPNEQYRPNLCAFDATLQPQCRTHACTADSSSGATINPLGLPVALSGGRLALEVCKPPGGPAWDDFDTALGFDAEDYLVIINQPARTFTPPPVIPVVPAITVCLDQVRSQGWCDCVGNGLPVNITACQDHVQNDNPGFCSCDEDADCPTTCTAGTCDVASCFSDANCANKQTCNLAFDDCGDSVLNPSTESCVCAAGAPGGSCSDPACTSCITSDGTGARCHKGTLNGDPVPSFGGSSGPGDCIDLNQISLKLLPPAICLNGSFSPVGQCAAPGSPDAGCAAAGGVVCLPSEGSDGVACTSDDLVPPAAPQGIPFVTGASTSIIEDAVLAEGSCDGSGVNCATDDDCPATCDVTTSTACDEDADCPATETCTGPPTCSGATLGTLSFTEGPGSGVSCALMESSDLAGFNIVGSFPALDGAPPLNDTVTTFSLSCD